VPASARVDRPHFLLFLGCYCSYTVLLCPLLLRCPWVVPCRLLDLLSVPGPSFLFGPLTSSFSRFSVSAATWAPLLALYCRRLVGCVGCWCGVDGVAPHNVPLGCLSSFSCMSGWFFVLFWDFVAVVCGTFCVFLIFFLFVFFLSFCLLFSDPLSRPTGRGPDYRSKFPSVCFFFFLKIVL